MSACPPGYHWYDPGQQCVSDIATGPVYPYPEPRGPVAPAVPLWEGPAVQNLLRGVGDWTKANPLITAGIVGLGMWIVSGRKLGSLRRLL